MTMQNFSLLIDTRKPEICKAHRKQLRGCSGYTLARDYKRFYIKVFHCITKGLKYCPLILISCS